MKQLARMSLAVTAIVASGWASVSAITACSSSTNNSGSSSSGGGSSGGSSGAAGSSSGASGSSSGGGSSGSCMLPSSFGNINTGTCPACATCLQGTSCCSSINACVADPVCNAIFMCEFNCNNNNVLPGDAAAADGGDCSAECLSAFADAGAISKALYTAEYNCWENGGPGDMMCGTTCSNCGATPEGGPGDDGGGDATTPPSDAAADAAADAGGG